MAALQFPVVRRLTSQLSFYGWRVAAVASWAGFMVYGSGLYAFTLFIPPLATEFGWDRASLGGAVSLFWLSAPLSLFTGTLVSRFGIRRLMAAGVVVAGSTLFAMSAVHELWQLYALRVAMGAGKVVVAVSVPLLIARWFSVRFGAAIAVSFCGFHFGGMIMAPVTQWLLDMVGWRSTAMLLGVGMIVVTLPFVLFVLRFERPQTLGLLPDGDAEPIVRKDQLPVGNVERAPMRIGQIIWMPSFLVLMVVTLLFYFVYSSALAHAAAFLKEEGLPAATAAATVGAIAGAAVLGLLMAGVAVDRWRLPRLLQLLYISLAVGVAAAIAIAETHLWYLRLILIVCLGLPIGAIDVVCVSILRAYFGTINYNNVVGVWYFVCLTGLLIGPVVTGFVYDGAGRYEPAFIAILVVAVVGTATAMFVRPPPASAAL